MFEPISEINNFKKKKKFLEKINIYIRIVEIIAEYFHLEFDNNNYKFYPNTLLRLKELNISNSNFKNDNKLLINTLKKNLYQKFISAVNFDIKYKKEIGTSLDKLDHSRRKVISKNNEQKKKIHYC